MALRRLLLRYFPPGAERGPGAAGAVPGTGLWAVRGPPGMAGPLSPRAGHGRGSMAHPVPVLARALG